MTRKQRGFLFAILAPLLAVSAGQAEVKARPRPTISVEAIYPGASAQVVADTVAAPIEHQVAGVDKMVFMTSRCSNDGRYTLWITFQPGANLDLAHTLVQKRVSLALPALPDLLKLGRVTVKKKSANALLFVKVFSPDDNRDTLSLSNYANIQLKHELIRLPGVAHVSFIGQHEYSFRIWLDPIKLAARNITVSDVIRIMKEQNAKLAKPTVGKRPGLQITVETLGRLTGPEEVEGMILKTDPTGRIVRLKDVARVELGAAGTESHAFFNRKPVVLLACYPIPQARLRELSDAVREKLSEFRKRLPKGIEVDLAGDFSPEPVAPDYLLLDLDLPAAASTQRNIRVLEHFDQLLHEVKGVRDVLALTENPFDRAGKRPCILVRLDPAGKREAGREQLAQAIRTKLGKIPEVSVRFRDLSGPSRLSGFAYPIDLAVHGPEAANVRELANKLAERLRRSKKLTDVWANSDSTQPQLSLDIDRAQAKQQSVSMEDILNTLQVYFTARGVNSFNRFGRTWQVKVQFEKPNQVDDLKRLKVRNAKGNMVALGDLVRVRTIKAAPVIDLCNGRPMVEITANPASGVSLAQTRTLCENLADEVRKGVGLPADYRLSWLEELPAEK